MSHVLMYDWFKICKPSEWLWLCDGFVLFFCFFFFCATVHKKPPDMMGIDYYYYFFFLGGGLIFTSQLGENKTVQPCTREMDLMIKRETFTTL